MAKMFLKQLHKGRKSTQTTKIADTTFPLRCQCVRVTHKVSMKTNSTADGAVEFLSAVHAASAEYFNASAEYFNSSADGGYESSNAIIL